MNDSVGTGRHHQPENDTHVGIGLGLFSRITSAAKGQGQNSNILSDIHKSVPQNQRQVSGVQEELQLSSRPQLNDCSTKKVLSPQRKMKHSIIGSSIDFSATLHRTSQCHLPLARQRHNRKSHYVPVPNSNALGELPYFVKRKRSASLLLKENAEYTIRPSTAGKIVPHHLQSHLQPRKVEWPNKKKVMRGPLFDLSANSIRPSSTSGLTWLMKSENSYENVKMKAIEQSVTATCDHSQMPDDVCFAEATDVYPRTSLVYRKHQHKAANPERLNLDGKSLTAIPCIEGEILLRLLSLQNNFITQIQNLIGLPNLIFLDLYNNRVSAMENLHLLPNLRVLMLGKNCIRRLENIGCLKKLDVLDLHSNEISVIENLEQNVELRVLNLGGNRITEMENLSNLKLLTELNLRRNKIQRVSHNIGALPSLQRLFLSNNRLNSYHELEPLFRLVSLRELRLDSNPVSDSRRNRNGIKYKQWLIKSFPLLRNLDLKAISEEERNAVLMEAAGTVSPKDLRESLLHQNSPGEDFERQNFSVIDIVGQKFEAGQWMKSKIEVNDKSTNSSIGIKGLNGLETTSQNHATCYANELIDLSKLENLSMECFHRLNAIGYTKVLWDKHEKAIFKGASGIFASESKHSSIWERTSLLTLSQVLSSLQPSGNKMPVSFIEDDKSKFKFLDSTDSGESIHRLPMRLYNNNTGIAEIVEYPDRDYRVLIIYGNALDILASTTTTPPINAIMFKYLPMENIQAYFGQLCSALKSPKIVSSCSALKTLDTVRILMFNHNDIRTFEQLKWLSSLGTSVEEIEIRNNPICSKALTHYYIAAKFQRTRIINGRDILPTDRLVGEKLFYTKKDIWVAQTSDDNIYSVNTGVLKDGNLNPSKYGSDKDHVQSILMDAMTIEKKLRLIDNNWSNAIQSIVQEVIQDIDRWEDNLSHCLEGL